MIHSTLHKCKSMEKAGNKQTRVKSKGGIDKSASTLYLNLWPAVSDTIRKCQG